MHWSPVSAWSTLCFCLCWLSLCTDLVSQNKTGTRIMLYVSFGADICFTGECEESEGTDIPLELEKWAGPMMSVCLIHSDPVDWLSGHVDEWISVHGAELVQWSELIAKQSAQVSFSCVTCIIKLKQKHSLQCISALVWTCSYADLESYYCELFLMNELTLLCFCFLRKKRFTFITSITEYVGRVHVQLFSLYVCTVAADTVLFPEPPVMPMEKPAPLNKRKKLSKIITDLSHITQDGKAGMKLHAYKIKFPYAQCSSFI